MLDPNSSTFWRDFYNGFRVALAEKKIESFFIAEVESHSKVRTVYQRLGATTNFLDYLREQASLEVNGVELGDENVAYFSIGGSNV